MLKFVDVNQETPEKRGTDKRKNDFNEIYKEYIKNKATEQSSRCSQCGVPFCQIHCPLGNNIPDWPVRYVISKRAMYLAKRDTTLRASARLFGCFIFYVLFVDFVKVIFSFICPSFLRSFLINIHKLKHFFCHD